MFEGHLGCHFVSGILPKDAGLVSIEFQYSSLRHKNDILGRFLLPLGAWNGLRYFIVALPEPSINYFTCHPV